MKKLCVSLCLTLAVLLAGLAKPEAKPSPGASPQRVLPAPAVETDRQGRPLYQQGVITVKVKKGVGPFASQQGAVTFGLESLDEKAARFQVHGLQKRFRHKPIPSGSGLPDLSRIYRLTFPESFDVRAVAEEFSRDPHVEYAEPMPVYWLSDVPNDSLYSQLQHLPQIMAEEAWDIHHGEDGAQETVIGMSDDALQWFHPDIVDNVWQNLGEDADGDRHVLEFTGGSWVFDPGDENAADDDGNGYIDDFVGWDFINEFNQQDNDPAPNDPGQTHGTHCAGIAAGVTDNQLGIASISWNVKIMATKHCNDGDMFFDCDPYDGIIYCAENGAHVSTNSWRGYAYSQADRAVIEYATGLGCLVVAAAGNEDWDQVSYPGGYPGCVSVASVAVTDAKASYSCYGAPIDVSAPGGDSQVDGGILSAIPGGYGLKSGTSMATPLVAGMLGLIKSYHPEWSRDELLTQLLGTADDIDAQNPGYEGMLGTGRINAFRALDETGVVPQELRLSIFEVAIDDQDGDGTIEPGETVGLDLTLQNHAHGVSAFGASFTLTTTDPDITILDGSCSGFIPADDYFVPGDGFEIEIAGDASPHAATLTVSVNALVGIAVGEEMDFELLVAPSGVLVWEGVQGGHDYSGVYISDFMERVGLDVVYTTTFPDTLSPFDAVFLSFGNYETGNTPFSYELAICVYNYLTEGGRVYLEGGDALGYDQAPATALLNLFGLASAQDGVADPTPVANLAGQTGALTEDMLFASSTQIGNIYIDTYTVGPNGSLAFVESNCGNVAVQGAGTYGQKTFCFSYALGRLADQDTLSNRCNLLKQIVDFFDLTLDPGYLVANLMADPTMGYAPVEIQFTDLSLTDPSFPITSWQWDFDDDGTFDSQDQNPVWTYTESGDYAVTLVVNNGMQSDTLRMVNFISVGSYVSGTWTAAGSPYYVSEEIAVADGDVLVIEPGVDVIFTGHYGLRVEGSLQAVGTEQDSILFTAQDPDTGWGGITIVPGSLQDDSTKIVYATVEHGWAKGGIRPLSSLGGGITVDGVDEVLISHCLIQKNRASGACPEYTVGAGGAMSVRFGSPAITHNSILDNTVIGDAGAVALYEASPLMVGNLVAGNAASRVAGAFGCNTNSNPVMVNNTICENSAVVYGGALLLYINCDPVLRNTILWGNTAGTGDQVWLTQYCDPDFYYCDVEGGVEEFEGPGSGGAFTGAYENCIDADPLFVDPANGDFNLSWANFPADDSTKSPCIDAGDPDPQCNDPDGTRNDIGALYFDQVPGAPQLSLTRLDATQCRLWWYTVAGATSYDLYRGTCAFFAPGTPWQTVAAPDTFHVFSDGVGDPATNYYFLCRSVGACGESGDSDQVGEFDFGTAAFAKTTKVGSHGR
jgi:PKD repeat protein